METITTDSINEFIQSKGGSVSVYELVSFLAGSEKIVCGKQDATVLRKLEEKPPKIWVKRNEVIEYLKSLNGKHIIYSSWDEGFKPHIITSRKQAEELISRISSENFRDIAEKRGEYGCHGIKHMNLAEAEGTQGWYIVFNYSTCFEDCQDIQIQIK